MPLFDTSTPLAALRGEIREAIDRVLGSERYIVGPEVSSFEKEFSEHCGAAHGVGVGPGDEVIVPSFTFYASAEAIPATGATGVFCDVNAETVRAALTPRTKAVRRRRHDHDRRRGDRRKPRDAGVPRLAGQGEL